ncbi:8-amino-7-oxononanoate synthase [uncultured Ilyobacter sp.]|uniref:8-amino-7-oxononanoate synthase n=1 Tax=uncultured Ilyobacter sp. TaxID=544433 RepID=UPI0029C64F68|nr:8-amino-7-oxononanoate synthase [uncultured Ilyobacter sp.]
MMKEIKEKLISLKGEGLFREIKNIEKLEGKYIWMEGEKYLDFSSSNYIGFRDDDRIIEAAKDALEKYGMGSGASRVVVGTATLYKELEELIASEKRKEAALLFNSGYDANLGIISTILGKNDVVFCDKLNHASIYDGIVLSGAKMIRFRHNDMKDLESKLKMFRKGYQRALIVVDSVFSMDGDKADLREIVRLKKKYDVTLMIDEAHGGGVLGENGLGLAEEMDVLEEVDINMGTFSKAYGSQGAYVAASKEVIDYLINHCRSLIYTTSIPPVVIGASLEAMKLTKGEKVRREHLKYIGDYLRSRLKEAEIDTLESTTQIVPVVVGDNDETLGLSIFLRDHGIMAPAIRKPTVTTPRIRISLSSNHSKEDIDFLVETVLEYTHRKRSKKDKVIKWVKNVINKTHKHGKKNQKI